MSYIIPPPPTTTIKIILNGQTHEVPSDTIVVKIDGTEYIARPDPVLTFIPTKDKEKQRSKFPWCIC